MNFHELAAFFSEIEQTAGRNKMIELAAQFIVRLSPDEIAPVMYLTQGRLVPDYIPLEFNLSDKSVLKALVTFADKPAEELVAKHKQLGDLGSVVEQLTPMDQASALSINDVYLQLKTIAETTGSGSQELKAQLLIKLWQAATPISNKYLTRVILGNLRLGLSDKSLLDAFSWAVVGDKSWREKIELAYGAKADLGELAKLILTTDKVKLSDALASITITTGVPVASKLVEREKDEESIVKRMSEGFIVQPKLDGLRAQLHLLSDGTYRIFSRNMENMTEMFPDLGQALKKLPISSCIVDSEAIGYDFVNDQYLPFNETMQRRRKHNVENAVDGIPIRAMCFDLLSLNGVDISSEPVELRIAKLKELLETGNVDQLKLLESNQYNSAEELGKFFRQCITTGLEGVIVKKLGTTYQPGTRNFDWIKYKANSQEDMVDTVDAVVMGYELGQGARAESGIGALLVGLYDPEQEKYFTVAKVGSGMTNELLEQVRQDLDNLGVLEMPNNYVVNKILYPTVWIRPAIVIEVIADEITRSPAHTAAVGLKADFETNLPTKGLSLRFPRLKIWRSDKNPTQITSVEELIHMYQLRHNKI